MLFESAVFKGSNIRATARKLKHVTDAASRFIKGVEPVGAELALERAIELVLRAQAQVRWSASGLMSASEKPKESTRSPSALRHINALLALDLSAKKMADMLWKQSAIHARTRSGSGLHGDHSPLPHGH